MIQTTETPRTARLVRRPLGIITAGAFGIAAALAACSGESEGDAEDNRGLSGSSGSAGASGSGAGARPGKGGNGSGGSAVIGTGGDDGEGGEGGGCGSTRLDASPPIVNVLLLVDKSSSMDATPTGFDDSKWAALGSALGVALGEVEERVAFGLDFFPFADDPEQTPGRCETPTSSGILIPIGPGANTVPEIVDALETYTPAGGTPTAAALARALDYFENGAGAGLDGERYVLLATDGGPNCNAGITCEIDSCTLNMDGLNCGGQNCCDASLDPQGPESCLDEAAALSEVTALEDAGVKTLVVGIPGTDTYGETLDLLAEAGGSPNPDAPPSYYRVSAMGGPGGLAEVLTRITTGLIRSCRLELTTTPMDPDYEGLLNVVIDGEEVPQAGDDGWDVDRSTMPPTVVLKGKTCETLETQGAEQVSITYGCPTVIEPR